MGKGEKAIGSFFFETRPLGLGGIGVLNLELMGWSLQIRWLWFMKTKPNRPWRGLEIVE
jgi:hypothetical protein